ncbi:MAG: DNA polymerase III subunit delta [Iphinoe sp. HA4291-MV1]|jgi:DNA polymerase-3 subunit delta|nr:DNA polymerase III subunit delta [Iphinoe sp. HA4291-MV1]
MPVKFIYGEDNHSISKRVEQLIKYFTTQEWEIFNYIRVDNKTSAISQTITEVMTIPFGEGGKIVHITDGTILNKCPDGIILSFKENLPKIPKRNLLLITSQSKPDDRSKAVKELLQHAEIEEFPLISSWDKEGIEKLIQAAVKTHFLELAPTAISYLVEAIGNNTARLDSELAKLAIYAQGEKVDIEDISHLVSNNNTSCTGLAHAIKNSKANTAAQILYRLLDNNEHALKIVATLISYFRTWLITKAGVEEKLPDNKILTLAELNNPKRLYFLKKEVETVSALKLKQTLIALIQLESELKSGIDNFTSTIIQICTL